MYGANLYTLKINTYIWALIIFKVLIYNACKHACCISKKSQWVILNGLKICGKVDGILDKLNLIWIYTFSKI